MHFSSAKPMVIGNWKMNIRAKQAETFIESLIENLYKRRHIYQEKYPDIVICPPALLIPALYQTAYKKKYEQKKYEQEKYGEEMLIFGAQDCHGEKSGAYTGDISASMLHDAGAQLTLVGHSERRVVYGEDEERIAHKIAAAYHAGLHAVLCIGENETIRQSGKTLSHIEHQLSLILRKLPKHTIDISDIMGKLSVAYEPIWAIGSGKIPSSEEISLVHNHIRTILHQFLAPKHADAIHILYGGSVSSQTIHSVMRAENVSGVLVGGASVNIESFLAIIDAIIGTIK